MSHTIMKNPRSILFSILAVAMVLTCCKKDATTSQFDTSLKAWNAYKAKVNNTYAYTSTFSPATDINNETTITIVNGNITARDFYLYQGSYNPSTGVTTPVLAREWHEKATDLNTHGSEGALFYTIDDLYALAKSSWIGADKSKNTVFFETNNNGIISKVGYIPNGCKEGCFIGIQIKSITP
ncbi:MAG: hypothetical protein V4560_06080 [Bacteroidota bacterium]